MVRVNEEGEVMALETWRNHEKNQTTIQIVIKKKMLLDYERKKMALMAPKKTIPIQTIKTTKTLGIEVINEILQTVIIQERVKMRL